MLLFAYYNTTYPLRWWNSCVAASVEKVPIGVLYYHRIADDCANDWTIPFDMFVRQMNWLRERFELISLEEAQRRIRRGRNSHPSVSVTFDDGYSDNCQKAVPWLLKEGIPCTYFVTLQNVLSGEPFSHDLIRGKPLMPNTLDQLRDMADSGIEIASHCFNHTDLGAVADPRLLKIEVVTSGEELQRHIRRKVRYFAFPFGQPRNLRQDVFEMAYQAGYEGVCSAYGGLNCLGGDAFHLQRIGVDNDMIGLKHRVTGDPCNLRKKKYQLNIYKSHAEDAAENAQEKKSEELAVDSRQ
jgi:peptidoglycan/xylan/chitin deacetylase (PgdA/CDA1 family)